MGSLFTKPVPSDVEIAEMARQNRDRFLTRVDKFVATELTDCKLLARIVQYCYLEPGLSIALPETAFGPCLAKHDWSNSCFRATQCTSTYIVMYLKEDSAQRAALLAKFEADHLKMLDEEEMVQSAELAQHLIRKLSERAFRVYRFIPNHLSPSFLRSLIAKTPFSLVMGSVVTPMVSRDFDKDTDWGRRLQVVFDNNRSPNPDRRTDKDKAKTAAKADLLRGQAFRKLRKVAKKGITEVVQQLPTSVKAYQVLEALGDQSKSTVQCRTGADNCLNWRIVNLQ
jgi:hypothetical protein